MARTKLSIGSLVHGRGVVLSWVSEIDEVDVAVVNDILTGNLAKSRPVLAGLAIEVILEEEIGLRSGDTTDTCGESGHSEDF